MGSFVIRFGRETSFFRWARRGEGSSDGRWGYSGWSTLPIPEEPINLTSLPGVGEVGAAVSGQGKGLSYPPIAPFLHHFFFFEPPHSHLSHTSDNIFADFPFLFVLFFFRLCFFPLRRSALLTPPTSLFPWHICNPERRRKKRRRRRRERKGAARKNGCHCSALMVFCV